MGFQIRIYTFTLMKDFERYQIPLPESSVQLFFTKLPWQLKFIPAIFCDLVPIRGYHRKPYIILSGLTTLITGLILSLSRETLLFADYIRLIVTFNLGIIFGDISYDGCGIEESRGESPSIRGRFQMIMWGCRAVGSAIGNILGPILWKQVKPEGIYLICGCSGAVVLFFAFFFPDFKRNPDGLLVGHDEETMDTDSLYHDSRAIPTKESGGDAYTPIRVRFNLCTALRLIWKTLSHPALKRLLFFNVLISTFPSPGTALFYYLINFLRFTPEQMGSLGIVSAFGQLVGYLIFICMNRIDLKILYATATLLGFVVTLLPLLVAINLDLPPSYPTLAEYLGFDNFWCSISEDTIGEAIEEIKHMAMLIVANTVCERTVEAGAYATVLSFLNLFSGIRQFVDAFFMHILHLSYTNFVNLPILIYICMSFDLVALVLTFWILPSTNVAKIAEEEERKIRKRNRSIYRLTEDLTPPTAVARDPTRPDPRPTVDDNPFLYVATPPQPS